MRLEYQKYWLAIVYTWLSRDKWGNEMQRLTQLKIEWHFSKSRLSATSIFAKASQNSLAWRCIGMAWKDYGDRIKVSYSNQFEIPFWIDKTFFTRKDII